MALALINQLTTRFIPSQWHDTYEEELSKIIAAKAKGLKPKAKGKIPSHTKVKDLMYVLKASLKKKVLKN
jgi:DNA end-binding protein Ku